MLEETVKTLETGDILRFVPDGLDWAIFNPLVLKKGDLFKVEGDIHMPMMHPTLKTVVQIERKVLSLADTPSVRISFLPNEVAESFEIAEKAKKEEKS